MTKCIIRNTGKTLEDEGWSVMVGLSDGSLPLSWIWGDGLVQEGPYLGVYYKGEAVGHLFCDEVEDQTREAVYGERNN